jgi:membrane associated rhomboid family serine protease
VLGERISMTYLYARRWAEAVEFFERPRNAPGTSPQLMVEMVRAYCELGRLEEAADLVQRIEDSPIAEEPLLRSLVSRGRLVFLAFVGRTGAVEAIVGPRGPLKQMPASARSFWSGIARMNAGDVAGARSSLSEAARLAHDDPRARRVAEAHLQSLDDPDIVGPHSVAIEVAELADRLTALTKEQSSSSEANTEPGASHRLPESSGGRRWKVPVTGLLLASLVSIALAIFWRFDSLADVGALVESGANLKSATRAGQWWRLWSALFVHVGVAHLAINGYALWVLGRAVERSFGPARAVCIFFASGLSAGLVGTMFGPAPTTAGASAAVMGLMGAVVAQWWLARRRRQVPRGPFWGVLLFLAIAQLAIAIFYPSVELWDLGVGLVAGMACALLLVPRRAGQRVARVFSRFFAFGAAALGLAATFAVIATNYGDALAAQPLRSATVGGLAIEVPATFEKVSEHDLYDSGVATRLRLHRLPGDKGLDATLAEHVKSEHLGGAREAGFDRAKLAARTRMTLPKGWRGAELVASASEGADAQRHRLVVFGRVVGGEIWIGTFYYPAALTPSFKKVFHQMVQSIEAE